MNRIEIYYPRHLVFGLKSLEQFASDVQSSEHSRLFIITVPPVKGQIFSLLSSMESKGITIKLHTYTREEPTYNDFTEILTEARVFNADAIVGIGGGSVLDIAKLVAALLKSNQHLESVVGIGLISERKIFLICIPTTSGTGSEVSPNAILLDEKEHLKKGIISPLLVPDSVYVDPELMVSMPPDVTAYTGMDALTHCIEAYANRFAHPVINTLALEGIRLITSNLKKAFTNGNDLDARSNLALGSLYGGMCLGPVNTAAVHALAYPLGSYYKIAHGISNAIMLPYVMEYNLQAAAQTYADIAMAIGAEKVSNIEDNASKGVKAVQQLIRDCGLPERLSDVGIKEESIEMMTESAIKVQRLLKNNVPELAKDDIQKIYKNAL